MASQTKIGRARLEEAQSAVGLSNERLARLIPVSEKTWRRWRDAGTVPTYALPAVARALRLELVEAPRHLHAVGGGAVGLPDLPLDDDLGLLKDALERLLEGQEEALTRLARLEGKLDEQVSRQRGRKAR